MKYRKRPVVIDAEQYGKQRLSDEFHAAVCNEAECSAAPEPHIHTLEGAHIVSYGDWIIKGVKGEFYPCKPDIFTMTYEESFE